MKTHFWITASLFHSATCSVFDAQTFAKAFKTTNNAEDGQHPNHHRRLEGIGDFPCYRNLQESYTLANDLETQAAAIPNLNVEVIDIGDSYEKTVNPAQGHDLIVVKITGDGVANAGKSTDKGVFFAQGGIHAREYATPNLLMTFAEELVNGYGNDADITSILDHAEVYLLFHANPDGRAIAEVDEGILWRRNTNPNGFVCTKFGVDLNRNYPFMWDFDNPNAVVSDNPCDDTYRGPSAGSEPETMAVADFGRSIFPMAQWPPDIVNVAVDEFTAKGVYLDVHAYGKMILWPFAHEGTATQLTLESPNDLGFETIARKFKTMNGYRLAGPLSTEFTLYPVTGGSNDFFYGELGAAGMALEIGKLYGGADGVGAVEGFYEECGHYLAETLPKNLPVLFYAAKISGTPFSTAKGPDVIEVSLVSSKVREDGELAVLATVSDSLLATGSFPTVQQDVVEVCLFIDEHPYDSGPPICRSMDIGSGVTVAATFAAGIEDLGLAVGKHTLYIEGKDSLGYKGPVTAVDFEIEPFPSGPVDVFILIDTSGSFFDDLPDVQSTLPGVLSNIQALNPNTHFGLGTFEDFPEAPWGNAAAGDQPFRLNRPITADLGLVNTAIAGLTTGNGADLPESQLHALLQVATDAAVNFRADAAKICMLYTDDTFHDKALEPAYPGPTLAATIAALTAAGIGSRRLGEVEYSPPIIVVGISGSADAAVLSDIEAVVQATGGVAGAEGLTCGGNYIGPGQPIVCTVGAGADITEGILATVVAVLETLIPVEAICKDVQVVAQYPCSASIVPTSIDNGSTGFQLSYAVDQIDFVGLGDNTVTLTITDSRGESDSCTATVSVVDSYLLAANVDCGIGDDWHISPCGASNANPLTYTATVSKPNGCPVSITTISTPQCERCQGNNIVQQVNCRNGVAVVGSDTVQVENTNGVGTFIRWTVRASGTTGDTVAKYCGVCVENGRCGNGKKVFVRGNSFACPAEFPSVEVDDTFVIWPSSSLAALDSCPVG